MTTKLPLLWRDVPFCAPVPSSLERCCFRSALEPELLIGDASRGKSSMLRRLVETLESSNGEDCGPVGKDGSS
jgi:hypothetical protein